MDSRYKPTPPKGVDDDLLVFVYGSLRKGFGNHRILDGAKFLGVHLTEPEYTLISLGPFPAVVPGGITAIKGELYEVDQECMSRLDALEGFPNFYSRVQVRTPYGMAWMYTLEDKEEGTPIPSGDWEQYTQSQEYDDEFVEAF